MTHFLSRKDQKFFTVLSILLFYLLIPLVFTKSVFATACCSNNADYMSSRNACCLGDTCVDSWYQCGIYTCGAKNQCTNEPQTQDPSCPSGTVWGTDETNPAKKCCVIDKCAQQLFSPPVYWGCILGWDHKGTCSNSLPYCQATFRYDPTSQTCVKVGENAWNSDLIYGDCKVGSETYKGIQTGIGCIPISKSVENPQGSDLTQLLGFLLRFAFGAAGGIIVLLMIATGYTLLTSQGNPEKVQAVKENIVAIISGLVLIAFSLILLQIIGANILGLPTFGP